MRQKYTVFFVILVIIALVLFWYEEHKTESAVLKKHVTDAPATVHTQNPIIDSK